MNIKTSIIAFSILSSAMAMHVQAQSVTSAEVQKDLAAWRASGLQAISATEQGPSMTDPQYKAAQARYEELSGNKTTVASLSRADVLKDLQAWQAAGMDKLQGDAQNTFSDEYQHAYAQYLKLSGKAAK